MFAAACSGMACFGISLALLGAMFGLPEFRQRLHINLEQQGAVLSLVYVGVLLTTPLVGPIVDRFGNKLVMVVSALLVTASLAGFVVAASFAQAALAGVALGIGGGGLNIATNSLVSSVYGEERGPYLNYLGTFYGVGALFIPLLAATLSAQFTPGQIILCALALAAVCGVAYLFLSFPPPREVQTFSPRAVASVATYPGVLLFAFLLFFQSGDEAVISGWVPTYAGATGADAQQANWVLSAVIGAVIGGRLLAGRVLRRVSASQLVFASLCGSLLAYALFWSVTGFKLQLITAALLGFGFSAIYPTVLAMVGDRYTRFTASVFSLIFTIGMFGGIVAPWVAGKLAAAYGLHTAMLLPIAGRIAALALIVAIRAGESRVAAPA